MGVGYNPKIVTNGLVLALDAGNTKSFPVGPSYSNYFDGSGDNLTTASSAAFNFGSGDFTVEAWFYPTALGRQHSLVDTRSTGTNGWVFYINTSNQLQYWDGASTTTSTSTVSLNAWSHLVWCRSGTTLRAFINGVQAFSTTNSRNNNTDVPACIGSSFDAQAYSLGYLSNVRIVKGTALYTANFTVPTSPLTAITNTSLLTCQSATLIDNSTNNFTLTRNGDVSVQTLSPFTGNFPTGTTWTDLSGFNYHHTLSNASLATVDNVACFDMRTTGQARPTGSTFTFGAAHTMIGWARALADSQVTTWRTLFRTSTNDHPLLIQDATNLIGYYDNDTNSFNSYGLNLGTLGLENKWTMFTLVASGGSTTCYINDNVARGTVAFSASGMNHDYIGNQAAAQPFGYVCNVQIYNRALTTTEIQQNFNALRGRFGI